MRDVGWETLAHLFSFRQSVSVSSALKVCVPLLMHDRPVVASVICINERRKMGEAVVE